jgi:lipopolysaccharide transport system ATP-binding protein
MYVRLAFAVAAHLEPEILIVDEVLAVGDAQFQQKCMGKMGDVAAREGRTVLFVSHNMVAVQSLCLRTVWLSQGQMLATGQTDQIVSEYLKLGSSTPAEQVWNDPTTAPGNDQIRFHALRVRARDGSRPDAFTMRTPLAIEIAFWNLVAETDLAITLHVFTQQGVVAFGTSSAEWTHDWSNRRFPKGCFRVTCNIPGDLLNSGTHQVKLLVVRDQTVIIYQKDEAISFQIHDPPESRGAWYGKRVGAVRPKLEWKAELC